MSEVLAALEGDQAAPRPLPDMRIDAHRGPQRRVDPLSVYVDHARNRLGRMVMCHMVADSLAELHNMAAAIGMKREWFQPKSFPHYDVSLSRRKDAVAQGAVEVSRNELVAVMRRVKGR